MNYQICKRCGSMFKKNKNQYCTICHEKNEKESALIREHIKNHPNATVMDIITHTGISLKTIDCLVEDGDISYVENKFIFEDMEEDTNNTLAKDQKKDRFHSRYRK